MAELFAGLEGRVSSLGEHFEAWLHHKNVGFLQQVGHPCQVRGAATASCPQPYLLPSPLMSLSALCELCESDLWHHSPKTSPLINR